MNAVRIFRRFGLMAALALATLWVGHAQAAYYYRWAGNPTYTCTDQGGGMVSITTSSRNIEWHLPADGAQRSSIYATNGVEDVLGPYALAGGDGSVTYAPLGMGPAALPAVFTLEHKTLIGGKLVYSSTMTAKCTMAGQSGLATITNVVSAGATTNYQDWWWNPTLDGMGINIAHQGNSMALVWYLYDDANQGSFLIMSGFMSGNTLSGTLFRATGPEPGFGYDPADVHYPAVGTGSIQFISGNSAKFTYSYGMKSGTINLSRLNFNVPDRNGTWHTAIKGSASGCTNPLSNGSYTDHGTLVTAVDGSALVMHLTYSSGVRCDYTYTHDQNGAYASGTGTFTCTNGVGGTATYDNLRILDGFLTMEYSAETTTGETCDQTGKLGGVK